MPEWRQWSWSSMYEVSDQRMTCTASAFSPGRRCSVMSNSLGRRESLPKPMATPLSQTLKQFSTPPKCSTMRRLAHALGTLKVVR